MVVLELANIGQNVRVNLEKKEVFIHIRYASFHRARSTRELRPHHHQRGRRHKESMLRVRLHGLGREELNGAYGEIIGQLRDGRYPVRLATPHAALVGGPKRTDSFAHAEKSKVQPPPFFLRCLHLPALP